LPDEVINQISAGEVIERPASVVRELLDNSIDAGATEVVIEVEEGGRRSIKVSDNGKGLRREDLILAFQNHATSKLRSAADLSSIQTFGFRGEALSSIAAIARVEMRSRLRTSDAGNSIRIEGGQILGIEPVAKGIGTEVNVKALFFNTPARRKFLKTGTTEEAKIKQWVVQSAIPNFTVSYKLFIDGKCAINLPPAASLLERAGSFLKGSVSEVYSVHNDIKVTGLIGHPGAATSKASNLVILVNKRVIKDNQIVRAIREGFDSMLKGAEVPIGIVALELPPAQVDVNVHPQKSEVRFVNAGDIFIAVRDAVRRAVSSVRAPIQVEPGQASSERYDTLVRSPEIPFRALSVGSLPSTISYQSNLPLMGEQVVKSEGTPESPFVYSKLRYIGQLLKCYLLCEFEEEFFVVDMHAAHERINYNRIRQNFRDKNVAEQRLLTPVIVEVSPEQFEIINASVSEFNRWGFDIESFGDSSFILRSSPPFIDHGEVRIAFLEMASEQAQRVDSNSLEEKIDRIAARLACHSSIRSGHVISPEAVYSLFSQLDGAISAGACPHGRPIAARFKETDIEKWFGRDR